MQYQKRVELKYFKAAYKRVQRVVPKIQTCISRSLKTSRKRTNFPDEKTVSLLKSYTTSEIDYTQNNYIIKQSVW